ncbi:MAG: hypothetical protein IJX61_02500 [Ruminococcus sp.]|nr:hypothetical protein [Ruminococcus sp.]
MTYSSLPFIYIFLPLSLAVYLAVPKKLKDMALYLESLVFCGFMGIKLMAFMVVYCLVNYISGLSVYYIRPKLKSFPLAVGILFDVIMLISFRHSYFAYLHGFTRLSDAVFPVGISLFTLSAIGYLADIYKGHSKADKNFIRFSLYIMMFQRLIMGTIVSYDTYVHTLKKRRINITELGSGFICFIKGLAKKVIIADSLFVLNSAVRSTSIQELSAAGAWLGILAYVLCLYFTLSGFSDMSVGLCRCFGMKFSGSFNYPLFGSKIRVFVSGWHIQVLHWFRKYITSPLSSKTDNPYLSKLVFVMVWMLAGIWYGFSTGGAVWGMLMGIAVLAENKLNNRKRAKPNGIIYSMLSITLMMVFLSQGSISRGLGYLWVMFGGNGNLADSAAAYMLRYYIVILLIAVYASTDLFRNTIARIKDMRFGRIISAATPAVVTAMLIICTSLMAYSGQSDTMIIRL